MSACKMSGISSLAYWTQPFEWSELGLAMTDYTSNRRSESTSQ